MEGIVRGGAVLGLNLDLMDACDVENSPACRGVCGAPRKRLRERKCGSAAYPYRPPVRVRPPPQPLNACRTERMLPAAAGRSAAAAAARARVLGDRIGIGKEGKIEDEFAAKEMRKSRKKNTATLPPPPPGPGHWPAYAIQPPRLALQSPRTPHAHRHISNLYK
eukprot:scaffold969_cov106-Isochrysis_galbana.AAC.2